MATFLPVQRRPLASRSLQTTNPSPPSKQPRVVSGAKRARSPDHTENQTHTAPKRVRSTVEPVPRPTASASAKAREHAKDKQNRLTERLQREEEFKRKYKKDFPGWRFYIDSENLDSKLESQFKAKILRLGGQVHEFFSSGVSHLVTTRPIPKPNTDSNRENKENSNAKAALRSPIKLIGRPAEETTCSIVNKALEYGLKIWTADKLESVLTRCMANDNELAVAPSRTAGPSAGPQRALSRLLQNEKIHGSTERDPTQKRRDWHYFTRGSYFVLVEDMSKELATIAAHEYPPVKDKDSARRPWPVLHCHPLARNPFAPFDDREKRRYEKQQAEQKEENEIARANKERQQAIIQTFKRKAEAMLTMKAGKANAGGSNLRKTISMSNLHRRLSHPVTQDELGFVDLEDDEMESANASGYNPSGAGMNYIAASGNSVGITSTTGTTSTTGLLQRGTSTLPDRFGRHVLTSLKAPGREKEKAEPEATTSQMGPPSKLPDRAPMLRKSKSTNTLKLPKREEGAKPGYCESCRIKFEDFSIHIISSRHRKFAANPSNFTALDKVLNRLQRKNRAEIAQIERDRSMSMHLLCPQYEARNTYSERNIELSSP